MARRPILFAGGFLLTDADQPLALPDAELEDLVAGWTVARVGRYVLRYDATWRAGSAATGETDVLLIGTAMNLDSPSGTQQQAVERLASALNQSEDAFFDVLDALVGAHVIIARRGPAHWALQDATGMASLAYDTNGPTLAASHPALVAELRGRDMTDVGRLWQPDNPSPEAQAFEFWNGPWHVPGVATAFEGVRTLTPNTRLDLATRTVERFFPRAPVGSREMETIVDQVAGHLADVARWVVGAFPDSAAASLSGGIDSRLTLAATRPVARQLPYFTYYLPDHPVYRNDLRVAQTLAERFGLDHRAWTLGGLGFIGDAAASWKRTHRNVQGHGPLVVRHAQVSQGRDLHVRSNVLEVVRGVFLKNPAVRAPHFDAARLSSLFRRGAGERFLSEYEEFIEVTAFTPDAPYDLHYSELYHWEQRLGRWHADLVRALKPAHDTFVLWNSRRLLTLMLSRPVEERWQGRVVHRLIDRLWPELLRTPVFSGSSFLVPPADLEIGPPPFAWDRVAPEVRLALARALDPAAQAAGTTGVLEAASGAPEPELFEVPGMVEAALAEWLPGDPVALDQVYAARISDSREARPISAQARVRRIDQRRARPAGLPLRRALAAALRAAGGPVAPVPDRSSLRPWLTVPTARLLAPPLAGHQETLLAALRAHGADGPPSGVVEMAAGAGSLRTMARWLLEDAVHGGGRVLWIAEERVLLEQAALAFLSEAARLRERRRPLVLRLLGGGYGSAAALAGLAAEGPDVIVATPEVLGRYPEALGALLERHAVHAVVDAAHRLAAARTPAAIEQVRAGARATVGRVAALGGAPAGAREAAVAGFGEVLGGAGARELIEAGAMARPRAARIETGFPADAGLDPVQALEGGDRGLAPGVRGRLAGDERDRLIVEGWVAGRERIGYGPTIAYAVDDGHAQALAQQFTAVDVAAAWISSVHPGRQSLVDRFRDGIFEVLITADPVPEGVELGRADTVLLGRPVGNEDVLGVLCAPAMRGRAAGGTEDAYLVTVADVWERETAWLDAAEVLARSALGGGEPATQHTL